MLRSKRRNNRYFSQRCAAGTKMALNDQCETGVKRHFHMLCRSTTLRHAFFIPRVTYGSTSRVRYARTPQIGERSEGGEACRNVPLREHRMPEGRTCNKTAPDKCLSGAIKKALRCRSVILRSRRRKSCPFPRLRSKVSRVRSLTSSAARRDNTPHPPALRAA